MITYNKVERNRSGAGGKLVKKLLKSWKIVKKFKNPKRSKKFIKAINL